MYRNLKSSVNQQGYWDNMVLPASPDMMEILWFCILWAANEAKLAPESRDLPCKILSVLELAGGILNE